MAKLKTSGIGNDIYFGEKNSAGAVEILHRLYAVQNKKIHLFFSNLHFVQQLNRIFRSHFHQMKYNLS